MSWNKIEWHELLLSLKNLPEVNRRLKALDKIYNCSPVFINQLTESFEEFLEKVENLE